MQYLHADERGSIVLETDGTSVLESHQYDDYGVPVAASSSLFRYTGQIQLKGTELYHYRARAYHPGIGRFLQTDPIGYEDQMNLYAYVGNDPVNAVDPSGEIAHWVIGGVVGGVVSLGLEVATSGRSITLGQAVGAFIGGATTGALVATGVPLPAANATGSALGNVTNQVGDMITGDADSFSVGEVATKTVTGAALSKMGAIPFKGVTKGKGNMDATFRGVLTKMENGNAASMSIKTAAKGTMAGLIGGSNVAATSEILDRTGMSKEASQMVDTGLKNAACDVMGVANCN